jgi:probable addiction module antidote protein
VSTDQEPRSKLRDDPLAIADSITAAFETNDLKVIFGALKTAMRAQNVKALAENGGLRRDRLYRTFDGAVDPPLSRVIRLLAAMNVQLVAIPLPAKPKPPRPKLGRPLKRENK